MQTKLILPEAIAQAGERISGYINHTPILRSAVLNEWLGHEIFFKAEGFQKIGAFKSRGALNTLLSLKEQNILPKKVVAFSSGNHAQALAWASKKLDIEATVFLPEFTSKIKQAATRNYGANVINVKTRKEAEERSAEFEKKEGAYLISPFDNDFVIAGQGTSAYEALQEIEDVNAIFAACGGGGLLSGSYLAKQLLSPKTKLFGVEPLAANDASISYREGKIFKFDTTPETIADGARTPCISERTFNYLRKLDGFFEASEDEIIYWTQWLIHLLKVSVEPTSALAMAGAFNWLKTRQEKQRVMIMLSGGNIDFHTYQRIWKNNHLEDQPLINL